MQGTRAVNTKLHLPVLLAAGLFVWKCDTQSIAPMLAAKRRRGPPSTRPRDSSIGQERSSIWNRR